MLHKLLLDTEQYTIKPTKPAILTNRILDNPIELTIQELCAACVKGQTFTPAYLEGGMKNENWVSQSIFALDFDKGITFEEVKKRADEYSVPIAFAYETFSSTEACMKFRVITQLDFVCTNVEQRKGIQLALMALFPECDKACKDERRMYYGGKSIIHTEFDKYLDIQLLISSARSYSTRESIDNQLSRSYDKFDRNVKTVEVLENPYKKIREFQEFDKNSNTEQENNNQYLLSLSSTDGADFPMIANVDFSGLAERVEIFRDFLDPNCKLNHVQLLGLATALVYMEGGVTLFYNAIDANPDYAHQEKKRLIKECRKYRYHAMSFKHFSPYTSDWNSGYTNLYEAAKVKRGNVVRLEKYKAMPLLQAEELLESTLKGFLIEESTNILIIKKATGLGGTTLLARLINESNLSCVVAFPNHDLKKEKIDLFESKVITPALPTDIPKKLKDKIDYYYRIGSHDAANRLIKDNVAKLPSLRAYRDSKLQAYKSDKTILTTHAQAMFVNFDRHNTYIFDEDPLQAILSKSHVTLNDLNILVKLAKNTRDRAVLQDFVHLLTSDRANCVMDMPTSGLVDIEGLENAVLDYQPQKKQTFSTDVLRFLYSDYYAKNSDAGNVSEEDNNIHFLKHNSLNSAILKNKKIIILSATADEFIYRQLYGDRVKFVDISDVESVGIIYQDTKYSCSRRSLCTPTVIQYINSKINSLPAITFKTHGKALANSIKTIYFGKTTGFDNYKGKNIAVVGTPHYKIVDYLLYGKALGIPIRPQDFRTEEQKIRHNGIECIFRTFTNLELRLVQLHFIETELVQAVGRARAIRYDCVVYLFSNFPYKSALITESEKSKHIERIAKAVSESGDDYTDEIIDVDDDFDFLYD